MISRDINGYFRPIDMLIFQPCSPPYLLISLVPLYRKQTNSQSGNRHIYNDWKRALKTVREKSLYLERRVLLASRLSILTKGPRDAQRAALCRRLALGLPLTDCPFAFLELNFVQTSGSVLPSERKKRGFC